MSEEAKAGEANASKSEHKHEHKSFGWKSSPSKIERLCMHSEPKSGPPPLESKRNMDTKVPIRRPNDDFIKSSLSDVCEENEIDFAKERFSRSSLSPESIYGKPPKPFDKADLYLEATGRRRSSDQGIVLTTNTDSFIIGQKVWVGGIRPGQIAYIGETHFAPGEWAGIVLDEPNGKNDGCVAGKRYFQCEPKKGIFSRLTRLTHEPIGRTSISKDGNVEYDRRTITPDRSRTASPTSSLRSINMKNGGKNGMCIGDRVIVSSGLGSRPGILQYMGETKFAAGNWCGIQLDDPTGKNNGSVDGIRYFDCPPKYGIFVPIAKVSLSPGSKKSRLSRAGSKESLTSVGTGYSVASTNTSRLRMGSSQKLTPTPKPISTSKNNFSLQDVIREKQNHIEQLMIERDLDREDAHNQVMILQRNINEPKSAEDEFWANLVESQNVTLTDLRRQFRGWSGNHEEHCILHDILHH